MTRELLTGNQAAAWGARLAHVDYTPFFPITPQTEIMETIAGWVDDGTMPGRLVTLESEHSMVTAAGAGALAGVRVFTATSSQGLLYAMEMLYTVSGWRVPLVMVNVSRGLSSPITLEPDHNDILAARDSGWLQLHCATCQEVLDAVLIAYRLAEHPEVRLPVLVNMDGFYLSFTRETVRIPDAGKALKFVGPFEPAETYFSAGHPMSQGVAVLGGTPYSYFRYQHHLAAMNALTAFDEVAAAFDAEFGRKLAQAEGYRLEDAEVAFVMMGSFATKAKDAVDRLREEGGRVGLLRPFLLRPFPEAAVRRLLAGKMGVAVIDQNLAPGKGGVLHGEIAASLYGQKDAPKALTSFIGGLGGRDIGFSEFREMASVTKKAAQSGKVPPPRLLFTRQEMDQVAGLQAIALPQQSGTGGKK